MQIPWDVVGVALGVVALILALIHVKEIKQVLMSVSTRYIDEFPRFIPEIVNVLETAQREVVIFCDIPAYGYFSAHEEWLKYRKAIVDLEDNVSLELICLDHSRRHAFYHEFLQGRDWDQWRKDNSERLQNLLEASKSKRKVESLTEEDFAITLEDVNKHMIQDVFYQAQVIQIKPFMPTYFWLVDGKRAVFSIPVLQDGHVEYGFTTNDPKLIKGLREMKERYKRIPSGHTHHKPLSAGTSSSAGN